MIPPPNPYPDETALRPFPNEVLKLVLDYAEYPHINLAFSQVTPRWTHCHSQLAAGRWQQLKLNSRENGRLDGNRGLIELAERAEKIERRHQIETPVNWFVRLDQKMRRRLFLEGLPQATIDQDFSSAEGITAENLVGMQGRITEIKDRHLMNFMTLVPTYAIGRHFETAEEIRRSLEREGELVEPTHIDNHYRLGDERQIEGILPKEIGYFVGLTEITLNRQRIQALPPEFEKLSKLKELHLAFNQIERLPNLEKLTSLRVLDLRGNPLKKLPEGIQTFVKQEDFKLILDRDQFLLFKDQLEGIIPKPALGCRIWYFILFFIFRPLVYFCVRVVHFGVNPLIDLDESYFTSREIETFASEDVHGICVESRRGNCAPHNALFQENRYKVAHRDYLDKHQGRYEFDEKWPSYF